MAGVDSTEGARGDPSADTVLDKFASRGTAAEAAIKAEAGGKNDDAVVSERAERGGRVTLASARPREGNKRAPKNRPTPLLLPLLVRLRLVCKRWVILLGVLLRTEREDDSALVLRGGIPAPTVISSCAVEGTYNPAAGAAMSADARRGLCILSPVVTATSAPAAHSAPLSRTNDERGVNGCPGAGTTAKCCCMDSDTSGALQMTAEWPQRGGGAPDGV